ncbi:hypothetical protein [Microvirga alba]|uniref:Uncharacterized protein n=1 Tax=Microvirga alba TaxID=2791025 RepID=A0A931BQQ0_9HYPH|nr:hypothetical protein [Microvirga alba]MBF9233024.1 hypothetical protein [Microvirga alba]
MRKVIATTLAASAVGAASLLLGSTAQVRAQALTEKYLSELVAQPGTTHSSRKPHRRVVHHGRHYAHYYHYGYGPDGFVEPRPYDLAVTGSIGPAGPGVVFVPRQGFGAPALWQPCFTDGPACTAAGYPNLHYYREIEGLGY